MLLPGLKLLIPKELEISMVRSSSVKMFIVAVFIAAKTLRKSNATIIVDGRFCKYENDDYRDWKFGKMVMIK